MEEKVPNFGTREEPMFSVYNNETPTDVYNSMASGKAQVNAMSEFLQESETSTKSNVKIFEGTGFNLGNELPYIELVGPRDSNSNISTDFSKSEKRLEPYTQFCESGENTETCLRRKFSCDPDRPWKECVSDLSTCKDDPTGQTLCRYEMDGTLLKKFDLNTSQGTPMISNYRYASQLGENEARLEPFMSYCETGETNAVCLKRVFDCDPEKTWKECSTKLMSCKNDGPVSESLCRYDANGNVTKKYTPLPKPPIEEKVQMLRSG